MLSLNLWPDDVRHCNSYLAQAVMSATDSEILCISGAARMMGGTAAPEVPRLAKCNEAFVGKL